MRTSSLSSVCLGIVLSLYPQQGQYAPSHFMKIEHALQRFCPIPYLLPPTGLVALYLSQISLQA